MLNFQTGHHRSPMIMLLIIALAVLIPTACVLWFMNEAIKNERLAVNQKLVNIYQHQLRASSKKFQQKWDEKLEHVKQLSNHTSAAETFFSIVTRDIADSVIIYNRSGHANYPTTNVKPIQQTLSQAWSIAQRLEFQQNNPAAAGEHYAEISRTNKDNNTKARALQAWARCLAKTDKIDAAIDILSVELVQHHFQHSTDFQGRFIQENALLRALQLIRPSSNQESQKQAIVLELHQRLLNYNNALPAAQRLFLMHQLEILAPDTSIFPTRNAEELAIKFLNKTKQTPLSFNTLSLTPSPIPAHWYLITADRKIVLLFTSQTLLSEINTLLQNLILPEDIHLTIITPDTPKNSINPLVSVPLSDHLPDWKLALQVDTQSALNSAAEEQIAAYLWTGLLIITAIIILAALLAHYLSTQLKLSRLKNDLIATASHELKTPLSSIRLLVDTLLDERPSNKQTHREYLQLIAKENHRLSRLIENFLTFSKMERKKQTLHFTPVDIDKVINTSINATRDKFQSQGFILHTDIENNLPALIADEDLLVMMLINLLDNACKYSNSNKNIFIRAYKKETSLRLEVEDNGIGLSARHSKKIFDRFYRVNHKLSQESDGCGLGLNIVKFIINAHKGSVKVKSAPNKGSTFSVTLPLSTISLNNNRPYSKAG